jgi:hypothetical protein
VAKPKWNRKNNGRWTENPKTKGSKGQSKDVGERRQKRKREDSKEDKLQPRNTVSQKDF